MKNLSFNSEVRTTQFAKHHPSVSIRHSVTALALLALLFCARAEIPEPDTIFYGRIINRTSHQEYLLTQGTLSWVIRSPDGRQITLTTKLTPLNDGAFSYSLRVPHQALTFGLTVSSDAIPLTSQPANCSHLQIAVDGAQASIMAPGSSTFTVSQLTRSSTYRLDLELVNALASSSGDGIPDWWKAKYGAIDPNADPDHDGWNNLQEFLHAANPTNDDRIPSLVSREFYVYGAGMTGLRFQSIDSDSATTNLTYTIIAAPQTGSLLLRNANPNPGNSDGALGVGSTFTQDDVDRGRIIFRHQSNDSSVTADALTITLRDENPAHPASTNDVALNIYVPNYPDATMQQAQAVPVAPAGFKDISGLSFYQQQMVLNYFLSKDHRYIVWDSSLASAPQDLQVSSSGLTAAQYSQYVATYGQDRPHLLIAGAGGGHLAGGMENDILIAGSGVDSMRGNAGSDLFVIPSTLSGNDIIEDFNTAENDAIDISRVLTGSSTWLTNYARITSSGTNSYLNIGFNGDGANYSDLILTLQGTQLTQNDLRNLVDNGNLITGNKIFPPRISISANIAAASQNGPVSGQLTITRTGPTDSVLTTYLQITGSAVNGSDYQYIPPQVSFGAGQRTATISVNPFQTSTVFTQVVQVTIISGTGYEVASPSLAQVTIEPILPQVSIQAIEPLASKVDQSAGVFLVSRAGSVNNSVLVRLTIGGTAPASHYNTLSSFLNFSPQQTTALISVTPKNTATLSNGLESVQITIRPDPSYRVMSPSSDRVLLVDQILTLGIWQQRYFPGSSDDPATFGAQDAGSTGIRNIYRYAYGLNPTAPQNSARVPGFGIQSDHLSVSFKRPPAISDLNYVVEVSDDLVNWRSSTVDLEQYFPVGSTNDFETVYYRSKSSVTGGQKQFMRVRVELQQ